MDGTIGVLALLFGAVVLIAWAIAAAGGPAHMSGLFHYPQPGWPHGVQEDDDAHWQWRRPGPPPGPPTERVRGRVRAGRGPGRSS